MALKIKLVKSLNGRGDKQIATAHSLGLHKIGNETIQPDNAATKVKGVLQKVAEREIKSAIFALYEI